MGETNANTKENLKFRGGIFMSLVPVAIFFGFCVVLFVIFKAFNMEALAMGGIRGIAGRRSVLHQLYEILGCGN